jgi:hypothetical protein
LAFNLSLSPFPLRPRAGAAGERERNANQEIGVPGNANLLMGVGTPARARRANGCYVRLQSALTHVSARR